MIFEKTERALSKRSSIFIFFTFLSLLFLYKIFINIDYWGIHDWDQQFFCNIVPRDTILKFFQFPLWNPYYCGGFHLLANPQSPFLSPSFFFILIFGVIKGIKIKILFHYIIGAAGMVFVGKDLKLNIFASYLMAVLFIFNSHLGLHIAVGHMPWVAATWFPWALHFYLRLISSGKFAHLFISSLFLSFIFLDNGVYVFQFLLIFFFMFALLYYISLNNLNYLKYFFYILILTLSISAVKLLPSLDYFMKFKRTFYEVEDLGYNLKILSYALFGRVQHPDLQNKLFTEGYHEYGAYVGIIPIILMFFAVVYNFKKTISILLILIFFLFYSFGVNSLFNIHGLLSGLPLFSKLNQPARSAINIMLCLAILSGFGLHFLIQKNKIFAFLALLTLLDLFVVNHGIYDKSFPYKPVQEDAVQKQFVQKRYAKPVYQKQHSGMLKNYNTNSGLIYAYEPTADEKMFFNAITVDDTKYMGEAFLKENKGKISKIIFTPNKITVELEAHGQDSLIINQNYYEGWAYSINSGKYLSAAKDKGLISVPVDRGSSIVSVRFLPKIFIVSLFISIFTLTGSIIYIVLRRHD